MQITATYTISNTPTTQKIINENNCRRAAVTPCDVCSDSYSRAGSRPEFGFFDRICGCIRPMFAPHLELPRSRDNVDVVHTFYVVDFDCHLHGISTIALIKKRATVNELGSLAYLDPW